MDDIRYKSVSCSGNAWKGFSCDQSLFPQIVEDWASLGDVASLIVILIALIFCILFWVASLRMNRDLTKSFMMPVAAPVSLLLSVELIHSLSIGFERSDSKEFFYTLEESEKYLQNVFHLTLLLSLAAYLLHQSASARRGTIQGIEDSIYVLILLFYTIACACMLSVFGKEIADFARIIIFGSHIIAYIAVIVLFFCAVLIFCICTRPSPEAVYPGLPVYAGYSRLGGALLFTQIVAIGPLIRGVLLLPLEPSLAAFLTNLYILLRFLLPLILFLSTCLFLPAYREAFGGICSPGLCTDDNVPNMPQIVSVQYGSTPAPRSFHNLERRDAPANQYQARVENVEV